MEIGPDDLQANPDLERIDGLLGADQAMTAPLTTLRHGRQRRKTMRGLRYLFSKPSAFEIAARSKRNGTGLGASGRGELARGVAQTHRLDDIAEWLLKPQNRESVGLLLVVAGCVGLMWRFAHA